MRSLRLHVQVWRAGECEPSAGSGGAIGAGQGPCAAVRGVLGGREAAQGRVPAGGRERPVGQALQRARVACEGAGRPGAHRAGGVLQRRGHLREPDDARAGAGPHATRGHAVRQAPDGHPLLQHRHEYHHGPPLRLHLLPQRAVARRSAGSRGARRQGGAPGQRASVSITPPRFSRPRRWRPPTSASFSA